MEYDILGWPPDGPTLRLDHERFSYAGKFVMTNTAKAVVCDEEVIVAAAAFNEDRTDSSTVRIRYVTVERSRQGEGIGPRLLSFVREQVLDREYDRIVIAVNNPYAYEASFRAGFEFTGETTGLAELVLSYPITIDNERDLTRSDRYRAGLETFRDREQSPSERTFVDTKLNRGPPSICADE